MRTTHDMKKLLAPTLVLAFAAAACEDAKSDLTNPDASTPVTHPDAAEVHPDASEPQPDASMPPPPPRTLVDRHLFGDMPLDNAVVDPQFDLSTSNWLAITSPNSPQNADFGRMIKRHYGVSPAGMPAVEIPKAPDNSPDTIVLGAVTAADAPAMMWVWIGRHEADGEQAANVRLVITTDAGQSRVFSFAPDGNMPFTADKLVWTKYVGTLDVTPLGISTFLVSDDSDYPFLITSPVVQAMRAPGQSHPKPIATRAPTPAESRALRLVEKKRHEHLQPPRRPAPLQP